MASAVFPKGIIHFGQGDIDWDGTDSKAALIDTGTYTYDAADEVYADIGGVVGTPVALASKTIGVVGTGVFDAANTNIVAVTGASVEAVIVYYDGATKYVQSYNELSGAVTPNGGDILISWHTDGIFSL